MQKERKRKRGKINVGRKKKGQNVEREGKGSKRDRRKGRDAEKENGKVQEYNNKDK